MSVRSRERVEIFFTDVKQWNLGFVEPSVIINFENPLLEISN